MGFMHHAPTDEELGLDEAYWYGEGEDGDEDEVPLPDEPFDDEPQDDPYDDYEADAEAARYEAYAEMQAARWDDDPDPYSGTYSEM